MDTEENPESVAELQGVELLETFALLVVTWLAAYVAAWPFGDLSAQFSHLNLNTHSSLIRRPFLEPFVLMPGYF